MPTINGRIPSTDKIATPSGPVQIWGVRKYVRERDGKPMVAINVSDTHRGFHLSAQQLIKAEVLNPLLLQGTTMIVDFYKKGEVLPLTDRVVTEDNMIVKSFTPEVDKELERMVTLDIKKSQANDWISAAARSSVQGRRIVTPTEVLPEDDLIDEGAEGSTAPVLNTAGDAPDGGLGEG